MAQAPSPYGPRFNGATAFRQWKRAPSCPRWQSSLRFNGATAFRQWKLPDVGLAALMSAQLQWGHRLSAVETEYRESPSELVARLQWGYRLSAVETAKTVKTAVHMLELQWGHRLSAVETFLWNFPRLRDELLQWGHHLSAVETSAAYPAGHRRLRASMGPPPFGSGNRATPSGLFRMALQLQWGHRLSAVETVVFDAMSRPFAELQWGHRLSAVEPPARPTGGHHSIARFNGATAFRQWKLTDPKTGVTVEVNLQWGHRLSAVETFSAE